MKSKLLPLFANERGIEPIVFKKANHIVSFKLRDDQFLDILKFLGGATSLEFSLKPYKASETKDYFPYEWFDDPEKLNNTQYLSFETFCSKLRNNNPLEKDYSDFRSLIDEGLTSETAMSLLKLKQPPAIGQQNYQWFTSVWQQEDIPNFKDFLRW